MSHCSTVVPAYGRDYRSAAAALKDWNDGKDFVLQDISDPYDGKPCSKRDFEGKARHIMIRYNKLTRIVRAQ